MAPIRAKFQAKQEAEKAERDRLETPSLLADDELRNQICALAALAGSRDRGEADRARAILLTLSGWTSPRIAEAFSVREDTVRLWRSDFSRGGTDALKASVAPGPSPVKSETALRVVTPLLEEPVANRPNWTIARMRAEIEAREGVRISRSQLSKALRKKSSVTGGRGTP
jgi:transposase